MKQDLVRDFVVSYSIDISDSGHVSLDPYKLFKKDALRSLAFGKKAIYLHPSHLSYYFGLAGTKVFYWNGAGQTVYGTVQQVEHMEDGAMVVKVRDDNGQTVALPANSVHKVT
ncbi:hypothetical protein B0H14DRAFT_3549138 [Mycena olivaceomarginata]|nr:hypothetical protein B0H14DRAFT_3549138 [Mycena olivaceomarginata]